MSGYYRPPWYPNRDPHHNPWATPDTMTGKTHYETWVGSLPPGELLRLIAEHRCKTDGGHDYGEAMGACVECGHEPLGRAAA